MPLTDVRLRQAKPRDKQYKMADGGGLYIEVKSNGVKSWRYRYRIAGKENIYAIANYPEMGLADARLERIRAAELVRQGIHPSHERAKTKAERVDVNADTFHAVAEEWITTKVTTPKRKGWSEYYEKQVRAYFKADVYPRLGRRPLRSITSQEWLGVIKSIAERGAPTAAIFVRQLVSQVYTYAINNLRADGDPTYSLRRSIPRAPVRHADAKSRDDIRDLLARIRDYGGNRTTAIAIRMLLLLFVRTKELRYTPWQEMRPGMKNGVWSIPEDRMKKGRRHMVPLPRQAIVLLEELESITGGNVHLFPNNRRPREVMSGTTVNRALEHMGYPSGYFTGHDFRATASTALHEMGYRDEIVEMQLAHAKTDKVGAAYNHAAYLDDRAKMMQAWADWIDAIEAELTPPCPKVRVRRRKAVSHPAQ
jgi:integrase